MGDREDSRSVPEISAQEEATRTSSRTTRRRFVRGAAAVTGGAIAASYVKPSMQSLGVSNALAQSSTNPQSGPLGVATQYCSQGYWKNHRTAWSSPSLTYHTTTTFYSVFTNVANTQFTSATTLLDVLRTSGNAGHRVALSRDAVSALLSLQAGLAVGPSVNTVGKIIAVYNHSVADLTSHFDTSENCPL